jgi:hypothetical protein
MKIQDILLEVSIDNQRGAGAVPKNADVDYFGLRVAMKPSTFLKLAAPLSRENATSVKGLAQHIQQGGTIGSPFLVVMIPNSWSVGNYRETAVVVGHEGRNRMMAVMEVDGDNPIEVHIFPTGEHREWRARNLTDDIINRMALGLISEKSENLVPNPFKLMK